MKNDDALDPVVAIAKTFDAEVRIAHVDDSINVPDVEFAALFKKLEDIALVLVA